MAKTQAAQRLCKEEDLAVEVGHLREEKSQAITRAEGAMSDAQMVQICTSSAIYTKPSVALSCPLNRKDSYSYCKGYTVDIYKHIYI